MPFCLCTSSTFILPCTLQSVPGFSMFECNRCVPGPSSVGMNIFSLLQVIRLASNSKAEKICWQTDRQNHHILSFHINHVDKLDSETLLYCYYHASMFFCGNAAALFLRTVGAVNIPFLLGHSRSACAPSSERYISFLINTKSE